ncbi:Transmembrane component BioN of energizing module of biotin ECF transporter [Bartonella ancashensis]|uniref:Transmembrane component BioN of energizing module of biotin ECF transporter n=1 Tax=Bartonella ancashensis TaxID=1318743 RepID=A0A0M5KTP7_9HYPH|nr:Transmembrane component BioN of energizing module of biotin ECF transporter [Bartonella ancashensis]
MFLILCGAVMSMVSSFFIPLSFLLLTVLLYKIAQIPLHHVVKQLKLMYPFLILIFIFQAILGNWLIGMWVVLRFIILVYLASLVSLTTKVSDMVDSIKVGFRPCRYFGINPLKLGMVLSMAIRFIPIVSEKFNAIYEAQKARGLGRNITAFAVPLVVCTIKMASEFAEALDARLYDDIE